MMNILENAQLSELTYRLMLVWLQWTGETSDDYEKNVRSLLSGLRQHCEEYAIDFDLLVMEAGQ